MGKVKGSEGSSIKRPGPVREKFTPAGSGPIGAHSKAGARTEGSIPGGGGTLRKMSTKPPTGRG